MDGTTAPAHRRRLRCYTLPSDCVSKSSYQRRGAGASLSCACCKAKSRTSAGSSRSGERPSASASTSRCEAPTSPMLRPRPAARRWLGASAGRKECKHYA